MSKITSNSSAPPHAGATHNSLLIKSTSFLTHMVKNTTWSNIGPQPTYKPALPAPASILNPIIVKEQSLEGLGLSHVYCKVVLSGAEIRRERRANEGKSTLPKAPLPEVNLPALSELYLRGSFIACGILLESLSLPGGCKMFLSITADTSDKEMQKEWKKRVFRYLKGYGPAKIEYDVGEDEFNASFQEIT